MSYNNGGRGNRNNFGSRGKGGGRGRGRGRSGGPRPDSEICRRFIEDKCDFGKPNGKPCRFPHFIKKIGETSGHNGPIKDVLMWSSRQQLFTCSQDSTIKLWDCGSWNELTTINVQDHGTSVLGGGSQQEKSSEGVSSMVMEGPFLFVGFEGKFPLNPKIHVGMIRGWNLENPQQPPYEFRLNDTTSFAHTQSVLSLSCAVDSTGNATLFSGSADGSIRYWQMDTTTNQFKCKGILEGHIRGITRLKTAILGTTPILASASIDSTIRLWDLSTYQCVKVFSIEDNGHTEAVMDLEFWVNGGETFLISGGIDQEIIVWGLSPAFSNLWKETQECGVTALCGTTDVNQQPILLIGGMDGTIVVKELPSFAYKTTLSIHANYGHRDAVRRISTGPMNTMFSVGNDRKMLAWQIVGDVNAIQSKN